MSANRLQLSLALIVVLLAAVECVYVYPRLPDPMASNFGGDGTPGGWSSKRSFVIIHSVSMAFWLGMAIATPFLASRSRQDFDDSTRRWLRDTIGWFLLASLGFSAWVAHLVYEANLGSGRLGQSFVWALAVYMAYVAWWTVRLVRRVRRASSRDRAT